MQAESGCNIVTAKSLWRMQTFNLVSIPPLVRTFDRPEATLTCDAEEAEECPGLALMGLPCADCYYLLYLFAGR